MDAASLQQWFLYYLPIIGNFLFPLHYFFTFNSLEFYCWKFYKGKLLPVLHLLFNYLYHYWSPLAPLHILLAHIFIPVVAICYSNVTWKHLTLPYLWFSELGFLCLPAWNTHLNSFNTHLNPVDRYRIFFIHSSVDGHLVCFHVLVIVNSATMNIEVHVSFWIIVLSRYMPRSGTAGSYYHHFLYLIYTLYF